MNWEIDDLQSPLALFDACNLGVVWGSLYSSCAHTKSEMNAEMSFPAPPEVIFKFFHPERSGILRDLRIRFANPADFNDPYEVSPRFDLMAEKVADEAVQLLVTLNAQLGIPTRAPSEFLENYKKQLLPGRIKYHSQKFQQECGEQFRMLCFSESVQSPLMWGHYCDSQRGFAFGFDTNHPFFQHRLAKVHYDKKRPQVDDPVKGLWIPLIKNDEWEYEKEWRIVQKVGSAGPHIETLPAECIKAVYFGLRISSVVRREIELALDSPSCAHIQKFEMTLDPSDYKLLPIPTQNSPANDDWWIGEGI